jgi:hypothetical protein
LNWIFRHFLPKDFDFSKIVPAHQLLAILRKCQAGLGARQIHGGDDLNFHAAIKRLKPLWYKDLVCHLKKHDQISPSLIEAFLAVFIPSVQSIKIDSNGDIFCDGVPKIYIFMGYTLDKAAETVALLFRVGNTIKGTLLPWQDIKRLSKFGIKLSSPFNCAERFPDLDTIQEDCSKKDT